MIPLTDVSRRPTNFPIVTLSLIVINVVVFIFEAINGEAFVAKWTMVPADISSGHHLVTILTAMFMHASWSHIIGNMIFLWAFGPEIEDAMGPLRYSLFYLAGGVVAMLAQVAIDPHSTIPSLGASGAIAAVMGAFLVYIPARQDPHYFSNRRFRQRHVHFGRTLDRRVVPAPAGERRDRRDGRNGRRGLHGAHRRIHLRGRRCSIVSAAARPGVNRAQSRIASVSMTIQICGLTTTPPSGIESFQFTPKS